MRKSKGKQAYQKLLSRYIQKRNAVRKKYNWKKYPVTPNPAYAKAVNRIAIRIRAYQKAIGRIEAKEKILRDVQWHVEEYTQGKLNVKHGKAEDNLTRKLFCTYVFLLGVNMGMVSEHMGGSYGLATTIRRRFLKSLKTNNTIWLNFKHYMQHNYKPTKLKK